MNKKEKAIIFVGDLNFAKSINECYYKAYKLGYKRENVYLMPDYAPEEEKVLKLKTILEKDGKDVWIEPCYA